MATAEKIDAPWCPTPDDEGMDYDDFGDPVSPEQESFDESSGILMLVVLIFGLCNMDKIAKFLSMFPY